MADIAEHHVGTQLLPCRNHAIEIMGHLQEMEKKTGRDCYELYYSSFGPAL